MSRGLRTWRILVKFALAGAVGIAAFNNCSRTELNPAQSVGSRTAFSLVPSPTPPVVQLKVRLGAPIVMRGPVGDELDAPFAVLRLANGGYRGFTANATTFAVDSPNNWQFHGARTAVLNPGGTGTDSECGRWMTGLQKVGGNLIGLVHVESQCNYADNNKTFKGMHIFSSSNEGLNWTDWGKVIGITSPTATGTSGEGDCTFLTAMTVTSTHIVYAPVIGRRLSPVLRHGAWAPAPG